MYFAVASLCLWVGSRSRIAPSYDADCDLGIWLHTDAGPRNIGYVYGTVDRPQMPFLFDKIYAPHRLNSTGIL